jgi:hypothetical protein
MSPGLVVDFAASGSPLGIEITAPSVVTLEDVNQVLASLSLPPASWDEVKPLMAG